MPVPSELMRVLEGLFCVDVESDGGSGGVGGGISEDDAGGEVPYGAFTVALNCFEVALYVGPVPVRFFFLMYLANFFLHCVK